MKFRNFLRLCLRNYLTCNSGKSKPDNLPKRLPVAAKAPEKNA